MSTINVNFIGVPAPAPVDPTPIQNPVLNGSTPDGGGTVRLQIPKVINNGNYAKDFSWSVSNILNGTFNRVETTLNGVVTAQPVSGTITAQPGEEYGFAIYMDTPVDTTPGATYPSVTADYSVQWV